MPSPTALRRGSPVRAVSYDTVKAGKAPIPIQIAPKPSEARLELHPSMRSDSLPEPSSVLRHQRSHLRDQDERRDSGLGTAASSTKRESRATTVGTDKTDAESTKSSKSAKSARAKFVRKAPSLPKMDHTSESAPRKGAFARALGASSLTSRGILGTGATGKSLGASGSSDRQILADSEIPKLPESFLSGSSIELPSFSLEDLSQPEGIQFSKRGSIMIRGQRPSTSPSSPPQPDMPGISDIPTIEGPSEPLHPPPRRAQTPDQPKRKSLLGIPGLDGSPSTLPKSFPRPRRSMPNAISRLSSIPSRPLTSEEEMMSRRIRSMYEEGTGFGGLALDTETHVRGEQNSAPNAAGEAEATSPTKTINSQFSRSSVVNPTLPSVLEREEHELAGGIEDWQGVKNDQVDRYGFIVKPPTLSLSVASPDASCISLPNPSEAVPEGPGIARMATQLRVMAETPRRSRSLRSRIGARRSSVAGSARSLDPETGRMSLSDRRSIHGRPASSQASYRSTTSTGTSRLRRAANHLPQNRNRKYLDEAGDMLTLPPGLAEVAESEALKGSGGHKAIEARSAKEREREEKWRKMAKSIKPEAATTKSSGSSKIEPPENPIGGGMQFTFDTTNAKLISRTWKGVPDRWRATAWWSFLATSARKHKDSRSETELVAVFYDLLGQSSPDDVQIDLDVPRTIGGHVMFRKRYRGGQRLLFRVLHAMSLYFPDPGYVQGMAALAATFLCYFQEELAFVMLVRMWELRGLAKLYRAGFEGLMAALGEFEHQWLEGGTVGEKLKELGITPTAYGTRWYLTVFNYSIPFSAQLRVWDVFLLLGDTDPRPASAPRQALSASQDESAGFNGALNVLHATSAALIDATREILLDSDFENAMKTLTSWVPVRDEDLLMRVAKIEYKLHKSSATNKR